MSRRISTSSLPSTVELSEEDVNSMGPREIRSLAKERGVSLTGCERVEQWKERLIMHLKIDRNEFFDIQREFGTRPSESLENIRQVLYELFSKVKAAVSDLEKSNLEDVLVSSSGEGQVKESLVRQIDNRSQTLLTSQCSVIVAGETNAGKSTFLNLLLGMDILPVHIFSCTAAICVLRYAPTFSASILYRDRPPAVRQFAGLEEARDWLGGIVAEKDEERRESGLDMEAIHVSLPAVILQSGVTLVDTPGIGENAAMTACTMDFVKKNTAAAYIYVIKTDNAGGVHDDRILEFLRAILEFNCRPDNVTEQFDPSAAMFVCNRWDQVPADQRDKVKDNALTKLKDVWPGFEPGQAFFVSAVNSAMHQGVDPRFVTEDLETVLKGLKDIYVKAKHNTINHHYRWLKLLLHQCTTSLQTTLHNCSQTDDELIAHFNRTRVKLNTLSTRAAETVKTLRRHVREEIARLVDLMASILKEEPVKAEMRDWNNQIIPIKPTLGSGLSRSTSLNELTVKFKEREQMQLYQDDLDALIMRRIMDIVDTRVKERKLDSILQDTCRKFVKDQLKLVDEEINSILQDMNKRDALGASTSSSSSLTSCASLEDDEDQMNAHVMLQLYHERGAHKKLSSGLRHVSMLAEEAEVTRTQTDRQRSHSHEAATLAAVPKVLRKKFLKPVQEAFRNVRAMRRQSHFNDNPEYYMSLRAEKLSQAVIENRELLEQMAVKHHDRLDQFIRDVENSIPKFIDTNKKLMDEIRNNRKKYLNQKDVLFAVMERMEPIREMLRGFGSLYIRDVTADNVFFTLDAEQRRESVAVSVSNARKSVRVQHPSLDSGIFMDASTRSNTVIASPEDGTYTGSVAGGSHGPTTGGISASMRMSVNSREARKTTQGLWCAYRVGHVQIGQNKQPLIGRSYLQGPSGEDLIKEISRLRCLRHQSLAQFLGMSRVEDCGGAVFLFLGDLMSARRYLSKAFHEPRESVPRLLESVAHGLVYLHRERLVHMELTLDTIMVDLEGKAQLCGACLPRVARFPPDAEQVIAEPFACLSPEVLRGELYTTEDDCYSFGLVVWETCLPKETKPYENYLLVSLAEFRRKIHPSRMLGLESKDHLTPTLATILRGCLLPARGLRTRADVLREQVAELRSDPIVQALSGLTRRHRPVMVKRPSDEASRDQLMLAFRQHLRLQDDEASETMQNDKDSESQPQIPPVFV